MVIFRKGTSTYASKYPERSKSKRGLLALEHVLDTDLNIRTNLLRGFISPGTHNQGNKLGLLSGMI
jgi:hypothetical protein